MQRPVALAVIIMACLAACSGKDTATPASTTASGTTATAPGTGLALNPLLIPSTLPLQAPPFDKIRDSDYLPAFEEGIRLKRIELHRIIENPAPPTFENTVEALERSGATLSHVSNIFYSVLSADTSDARRAIDGDISPKVTALNDEALMNPRLFARLKAVYDQRDTLGLAPEQKRLLELAYEKFISAGARLSDPDKAILRKLNLEEDNLTTQYHTKLTAATAAAAIVVDDKARLDGMSEADIAAAAAAAKARKLDGKYLLALQSTTQQPVLASLKDRALRAQILEASEKRAEQGDANDTRDTIRRLLQVRAQRARLLGFDNYAAYSLRNEMARTPQAALKLLTDIVPRATAKARDEATQIQALIDAQHGGFKLTASDWNFYAAQVRKAKYDLDVSQTKPYFELDSVLRNGVFYAATQLYGITFKQRTDIPTYHADMKVYEIFDVDGKSLALFYTDYFQRESKSGGAWAGNVVQRNALTGAKPVIYNVCNFTKPADGQPALLSSDEVKSMFHEFGHALHFMFSTTQYSTPTDFSEFPSQFNEHWANDPKVFANYARHYQTGEAMPAALVEKLRKSRTFNSGYLTTEYLSAEIVDLALHGQSADAPIQDVAKFEADTMRRFKVDLPEVPPRYRSSYFDHIWSFGYAAKYYAYFWSEVLDDDAFKWMEEHGGLTRKNGDIFRTKILAPGNSVDVTTLYRNFRGRDPSVEALLEYRGLTE